MEIYINRFKKFIKNIPKRLKQTVELYLSSDIPLYSANAAFFLIISSIPTFMLLFSALSLIPYVKVEDFVMHISLMFPNLPYVNSIISSTLRIAKNLATTNIISINIVIALIAGSTAVYSFIIGIRNIHDIKFRSNFLWLRLLSIINMFVFFLSIILMFVAFILGGMIIGYAKKYLPISLEIIEQIFDYKYLVSTIILFLLMMSFYITATNFERKIHHNIVGALAATGLWLLVSNIFSIYFTRFPLNASVYGSLAGIVVVLLWLFICINIIFLGAVINEIIYPEQKIIEERKKHIMRSIKLNRDSEVDEIINKRYNLSHLPKFIRPKLNKDNFYEDDN